MRLIDADALWMEVIHTMDYCDDILEIIEHQKTIEPTHLNDSNTLETLDCIGRQEAIEALEETKQSDPFDRYEYHNIGIDWSIDAIKALPSAQPKAGKWTWSKEDSSWCCGVCRCVFEEIEWKPEYNFCPNCGADLRGEQDDSV